MSMDFSSTMYPLLLIVDKAMDYNWTLYMYKIVNDNDGGYNRYGLIARGGNELQIKWKRFSVIWKTILSKRSFMTDTVAMV